MLRNECFQGSTGDLAFLIQGLMAWSLNPTLLYCTASAVDSVRLFQEAYSSENIFAAKILQ